MNHAFLAEVLCCFKEYAGDDSVSIAVAAIKTLLALIRKSSGGDHFATLLHLVICQPISTTFIPYTCAACTYTTLIHTNTDA